MSADILRYTLRSPDGNFPMSISVCFCSPALSPSRLSLVMYRATWTPSGRHLPSTSSRLGIETPKPPSLRFVLLTIF